YACNGQRIRSINVLYGIKRQGVPVTKDRRFFDPSLPGRRTPKASGSGIPRAFGPVACRIMRAKQCLQAGVLCWEGFVYESLPYCFGPKGRESPRGKAPKPFYSQRNFEPKYPKMENPTIHKYKGQPHHTSQ